MADIVSKPLDVKDLNLKTVRSIYPITEFKTKKQTINKEKPVPYEKIDLNLYKNNAHCTCFVTTEHRIHAWILALAESLYYDLGAKDNYDIIWEDEEVKNEPIQKTEFIVQDVKSEPDGEKLIYKVIIYLTKGKIMVQGKQYKKWCRELFQSTLERVNTLMKSEQAANQHEFFDEPMPQKEQAATPCEIFEDPTLLKEVYTPSPSKNLTVAPDPGEDNNSETVSPPLEQTEQPTLNASSEPSSSKIAELISSRLDIFEEALLKLTKQQAITIDKLNLIENSVQTQKSKDEIIKGLQADLVALKKVNEEESKQSDKLKGELLRTNTKLNDLTQENDQLKDKNLELEAKLDYVDGQWIKKGSKSSVYVQTDPIAAQIESDELHDTEVVVNLIDDEVGADYASDGSSKESNGATSFLSSERTDSVCKDPDLLFLHDSVGKFVEAVRLSPKESCESKSCPTIKDASLVLGKINHVQTVIIHTGINDLKHRPVEQVARGMESLVNKACCKAEKVMLSMPIVSGDGFVKQKLVTFESIIKEQMQSKPKLIISYNNNFKDENLFWDSFHPSRSGTRLLANNIIRGIRPRISDYTGPNRTPLETMNPTRWSRSDVNSDANRQQPNFSADRPKQRHKTNKSEQAHNLASVLLSILQQN